MPRNPRAAPTPAPIAAVGSDAPPVAAAPVALELVLLLLLALSVELAIETWLLDAASEDTDDGKAEVIADVADAITDPDPDGVGVALAA